MLGDFELHGRHVDDLTPAAVDRSDRFQRTTTLLTCVDRVNDGVIGLLHHFQAGTRMTSLTSRVFPAGLSQTHGFWFFHAIAGRRLTAVLAVFRQLPAEFLVFFAKLLILYT